MRITKEYYDRKNQILDTAERLFNVKGYEKCTINDILLELNIAKGTFYHYFKSKEEVLDTIVDRYKEVIVERAENILNNNKLNCAEKLLYTFMSMSVKDTDNDEILNELHKVENALMHQKTLNRVVTAMSPILVKVIEEGIEKKEWSCKFPLEYMQIFLASALTLTDDGIFQLDEMSQMTVMTALISILEKMLEVPENLFMQLFIKNIGDVNIL